MIGATHEQAALNILHVQASVAVDYGGPTTVLSGLTKAQVGEGHRVTVCTTDRNAVSEQVAEHQLKAAFSESVRVLTFPVSYTPILYSRAMHSWLRNNIDRYDIVHIHGVYRFPTTFAAIAAKRRQIPYIIRACGTLDPFLHSRANRSVLLKRLYRRFVVMPCLHRASAVHFTAEDERARCDSLRLRSPSFVLANGLDWERFDSLPVEGAFRKRFGFGDAPIVLFLGRLNHKKGLDLLIPAFSQLKSHLPRAQLAIVGPGTGRYVDGIRRLVDTLDLGDSVHFLGPLEGKSVVEAYVDSNLFCLPSYTENFGLAVIEAMASGLPVVISDQVNIHREVERAGAGIVTNCSSEAVGCALVEALSSEQRLCSMGENARRVAAEYAWPTLVGSLTRLYLHLLSIGSAPEKSLRWKQRMFLEH